MNEIFIPLLTILNALMVTTIILSIVVLSLPKNRRQDRARKLLFWLFILIGIACTLKITESLVAPKPELYGQVMILPYMLVTLLFQCMLIFYPMEVLKPDWITLKRGIFLLSPFFLVLILYYILDLDYIELYSTQDIIDNIRQPDVIFRIVTIILMVPYSILLPLIQYQDKKMTMINLGLVIYTLGLVLSTVLVTITMMTGNLEIYIFYSANNICLNFYLLYYEVRVRCAPVPVPAEKQDTVQTQQQNKQEIHPHEDIIETEEIELDKEETLTDKIYNDLLYQFDVKHIWKYANLDIQTLAHEIGTNKTYILQCIKEKTGYTYVEYVNRKRIDYIVSALKNDPKQNFQELFTNAGFNSRTTAWRNFKNIVGMTPTDYIKTLK